MKKLIIFVILTLLVLASVVASGGEEGTRNAKQDGIRVGVSIAGMGNSWRLFMKANIDYTIDTYKEQGVISEAFITNAEEKPEKQTNDIESLLTRQVDLLIIQPTVGAAIVPAVERAYATGIPVIIYDGTVPTDQYTAYVGQDMKQLGAHYAEALAGMLGGKGKIIMFSGIPGQMSVELRLEGAREVFEKNYPEIEVLDTQYTAWSAEKTKTVMETLMQTHPQIDGIWADSGLMSWPALEAMKAAGRPLVPSTSDHINGWVKFVVNNNLEGYMEPYTSQQGAQAIKWGIKAVQGENIDKTIYVTPKTYNTAQLREVVRMDLSDWWWIGDDDVPAKYLPNLE